MVQAHILLSSREGLDAAKQLHLSLHDIHAKDYFSNN